MAKRIRAVVDTNIFLYALTDEIETSCTKLVDLINNREIDVVFAQDTFGELIYMMKHTLRHSHIVTQKQDRLKILNNYTNLFYNSLSYKTNDVLCPKINDELDEMFIKCAIKSKADFLISDDFSSGMHSLMILKTKIVSSQDFMSFYENVLKSTGT